MDPKTRCITCLRKIAKPYVTPRDTVLKYHKMEFTDPFTATGTDYFGPITYFPTRAGREITLANRRRGRRSKETKIETTMQAYVCIFTCLATRNIHLELATDLSAEQFVHVLRRFMALKRQPKIILSDNAKYFVAAAKALRDFVVDPPIEWTFTRPKCPWEGGAYERMIGVTKNLMRATLTHQGVEIPTADELKTLVVEAAKIINLRPLTYVAEGELTRPLRPIDFQQPLREGQGEMNYDTTDIDPSNLNWIESLSSPVKLRKAHADSVRMMNQFRERWAREYLVQLRNSFKGQKEILAVPEKGHVVIIREDGKSPLTWQIGTITSLENDPDGYVRVATVKTSVGELTRSISQLHRLECPEKATTNQRGVTDMPKANDAVETEVEHGENPMHTQTEPADDSVGNRHRSITPTEKSRTARREHEVKGVERNDSPAASSSTETKGVGSPNPKTNPPKRKPLKLKIRLNPPAIVENDRNGTELIN